MKDLCQLGIGQQRLQVRRIGMILRNLHHVGAAVAVRQLRHAEPVAMRIKPHGLGIYRDRISVAGEIGQIAAMQAYGHVVLASRGSSKRCNLTPKSEGGERPERWRNRKMTLSAGLKPRPNERAARAARR